MAQAIRQKNNKASKKTNPILYAISIGFFAGVIWGGLKVIEFAMKFTNVVPGFLLEPYFRHAYLVTVPGIVLGYASFILFSVVASVLYVAFFRKLQGPWPGIFYGMIWWSLLYLLIGPLTEMVAPVTQLDLNSFLTDFCLFLLWGLFIGYSLSLEFTNDRQREPAHA